MDMEIIREMGKAIMKGDLNLVKEMLASNEGLLNVDCWLHDAATYGKYDVAKYLIECGVDVNLKGGRRDAGAITNAAFNGHLDIVELLYSNGAIFDISSFEGNPLFAAIYNGHLDVVKFLVENGIDLTARYDFGEDEEVDAYGYAEMYGEEEIAKYLKEKIEDQKNKDTNSENKEEKVMDKELIKEMGLAIINGKFDLVKELLESNEGLLNETNMFGTWLHNAATYGQYDIAKYLIDCGIDVNLKGGRRDAGAITNAAFNGHLDIVELLYSNGAIFDVSSFEGNPLFAAIYNGHFEVAQFLVDNGIDLTASYDLGEDEEVDAYGYARMYGKGKIAKYLKEKIEEQKNKEEKVMDDEIIKKMGQAVINGDLDIVKELLESNEGLLNVITPFGTWLHDAASYEQYDVAKYLIEYGIDVNVIGGFEDAGAIVSAIFEGNLDIVKLLYDNGAEFDVSTPQRNPLFVAIYNDHLDIVSFLVEKGIDLTVQYEIGEYEDVDAYKYARMYGKSKIAEYLKEKIEDQKNKNTNSKNKEEKVMDKEQIKEMRQAIVRGDLDAVKDFLMSNEGALNVISGFGTWLHDAASYGQYEVAKYLIECGIDVNLKAGYKDAGAITDAAFEGHLAIVELLLSNGAKLDVSDDVKNPLFAAIYNGHLDVVKCLVENGIDLSASYDFGEDEEVDAYGYAEMYGEEEIAEYLKEQMGCVDCDEPKESDEECESENNQDVLARLQEVYQTGKLESKLDKQHFIDLYKEAVVDIFPKLKEEYEDQSIYGLSFEIAGTVQKVYSENFGTTIYLNTEEDYEDAIEDCDEDEMSYYRFCAWAEWSQKEAESELFARVQDYLWNNSFGFYGKITNDVEDEMDSDLKNWYKKSESDIESIYEAELKNIRLWLAECLGQLRTERFWEKQGNPDIYVIPFEGEDEISKEELIDTYKVMDQGCHGEEYLEYLEER